MVAALGVPALGGGSPENVLLIINPASADALYVGNFYKTARNIPDSNVLYINPFATSYQAFAGPNGNIDAVLGKLRNSGIDRQIDYIVIADVSQFFIVAPGLMVDQCSPVTRFSVTGAYGTMFQRSTLLAGNVPVTITNQYFQQFPTASPTAFTSEVRWNGGSPSVPTFGERYMIAAQLGYTGPNGNTIPEIIAMIQRSAVADGTNPGGRFYYVNNPFDPLRNVRAQFYGPSLQFLGSRAIQLDAGTPQVAGALPSGFNDVLGVMTGEASPPIDTANFTMVAGSFADHLTSFAGTFDATSQTRMSAWIRKGASGTAGTVEEPCNYIGKFPFPAVYAWYFQELSLGEAYLRSMVFWPMQSLLYGDPLTRPFAILPTVTANLPPAVSGVITLQPFAQTTRPGTQIASNDVLLNGAEVFTLGPGTPATIDTRTLPDGWNEFRVVTTDSSAQRNRGRWVGSTIVNNFGRSVTLSLPQTTGTMTTAFVATVSASGGAATEVRLIQNERVIASTSQSSGTLTFFGRNVGSGVTRVQAEALFADGRVARSAPVTLNVDYSAGSISGQPPVAWGYTRRVPRGGPAVIELPASFDDAYANATWTVLSGPSQSTISAGRGFAVITAPPNASGTDQIQFRVSTPSGTSQTATVNIIYTPAVRTAVRW